MKIIMKEIRCPHCGNDTFIWYDKYFLAHDLLSPQEELDAEAYRCKKCNEVIAPYALKTVEVNDDTE